MTAEMPRTKPNIIITARLLLMPVFRSVELKVVLWAKAGTVLSANKAATVRSGRKRFRNRMLCFIFLCACFGCLFCQAAQAANHADSSSTSKKLFCAMIAQNKKIFLAGWKHEYDNL